MLEAFTHVPGGSEVLLFLHLFFCGQPSQYMWEDEGVVHRIRQGEGGDQGMLLCPFHFLLDNMLRCTGSVSSPNQVELAMCMWRFKRNSKDMPVQVKIFSSLKQVTCQSCAFQIEAPTSPAFLRRSDRRLAQFDLLIDKPLTVGLNASAG